MASSELRERRRESYETPRPEIQALVPRSARAILDLGCASGTLGAALKRRQGAYVVGVEAVAEYARDAERRLDRVVHGDVEDALEAEELGRFDCIVAADVLEHLLDPWTALSRAAALLEPNGTVVVSLPNVRYLQTFWQLGWRGSWPRHDHGLFDATHLRWFTLSDARELMEQAGLDVVQVEPRYFFLGWGLRLVRLLARTPARSFLAGQYLLLGRSRA
jgi:methionine biosynthesis protein MetW